MWRWMLGFLCAVLGALWGYTAYHTDSVEQAHAPVGDFVTAGGVRLHYVEAGSGPPVVLLHGAGANLNDFRFGLFDAVARSHRTIAFDRPGHGYSDRPLANGHDPRMQAALIHDALVKLGVEKPVLVGHSWSGAVVLAYALGFPREVKGIVLLAGVSHDDGGAARWSYRLAAAPIIGPVFRHTLMAPLGEFMLGPGIEAAFAPNPPPADYRDRAAARLLLRPRAFLNNALDVIYLRKALREMSLDYGEISVPVVIISGIEDGRVDPEVHGQKLNRAVPRSELVLIPDVGHMPHHIRPVLITDKITALTRGDAAQQVVDLSVVDLSVLDLAGGDGRVVNKRRRGGEGGATTQRERRP